MPVDILAIDVSGAAAGDACDAVAAVDGGGDAAVAVDLNDCNCSNGAVGDGHCVRYETNASSAVVDDDGADAVHGHDYAKIPSMLVECV